MRYTRPLMTAALMASALVPSRVQADPVTYEFSGVASGTLGGAEFDGAAFRFTLVTDTDGVTRPFPSFPNIILTQDVDLSFTIGEVDGTFLGSFHVFLNAFGPNSSVGLSPSSGDDLLDITDPSLAAYDLKSSFGPLTQAPPDFLNVGEAYATSAGDLIFADDAGASVTFLATVRAVPEPTSLALMGSGLLGLLAHAGRRRSTRSAT